MDIAEVVSQSGLPASTLRYYEEKGLIKSSGRHGLRRQFDHGVIERLALISLGRNGGLSLEEIGVMLASGDKPQIDRQLLLHKADELDQTIKQLIAMRDGLRHAAACPEASHLECPKFQKMMRLASHSNKKRNN